MVFRGRYEVTFAPRAFGRGREGLWDLPHLKAEMCRGRNGGFLGGWVGGEEFISDFLFLKLVCLHCVTACSLIVTDFLIGPMKKKKK